MRDKDKGRSTGLDSACILSLGMRSASPLGHSLDEKLHQSPIANKPFPSLEDSTYIPTTEVQGGFSSFLILHPSSFIL
ncbi:hypothetical protein H1P_1360010 [Hyella patelloides LEGE 07179]|uniref:Uncharacterized protein n=1 Tax=Hyella patelloides LEGE 07179 TaxID=945734 RepID=A0A563VL11_9CYAN|nr:hypothetical protein [Hyella patelloides]VEP12140.1 hypothetical protein H1P_1360010 [Hyella patelloides LEGE 07179]